MPENRHIPDRPVGAAGHYDRSLVHQRSRVEQAVLESFVRSSLPAADYCRQAIEIATSPAENQRRALCNRRRQILYDDWRALLAADIKNRITQKALWEPLIGKNGEYADISRNTARAIWEEMAVLYKSAAKRSTPTDPEQADIYKRLLRWSQFHPFMQSVEVQLSAFNDVIAWPEVTTRRGRKVLRHNVVAGDTCSVLMDPELADGPAVIVFFHHYVDGAAPRVLYTVHTTHWVMSFTDAKGFPRVDPDTLTPIDDEDPRGENLFDGWRFAFLHRDPHHPWFWDQTGGQDLIDLNLKLGRRQTDDDYLWSRSSFKQLLVAGNVRTADQNLIDPAAIIKVKGDGTISTQVIDWAVDFKERQDVVNGEEIRAAAAKGINPERLRRTSYQTAESARLSERGLHERRERFEPIFADFEDEYYYLCAQVAKIHGLEDQPDPGVELEVVHGPIDHAGDPAAQLDVDEKRTRLGYQAVTDVILAEHPSWTHEQALDFLRANLAELVEVSRIKQQSGVPENDLGNRSQIDEANGAMGPAVRDGTPPVSAAPSTTAKGNK